MTYYLRRKAMEDLARREAAGEDVWSQEFTEQTRIRLRALAKRAQRMVDDRDPHVEPLPSYVANAFALHMGIELGPDFAGWGNDALFVLWMNAPDDQFATLLEMLLHWVLEALGKDLALPVVINGILNDTRTAWEFVGQEIVPFESRELHQEVVAPTLLLLGGRPGWEGVEETYRKALAEIAVDPSDAITDAGTALQETLSLLGAEGNQIGDLLRSARRRGLLAAHDAPLTDALEKVAHWVAADRSTLGDTHNSGRALTEDAWFAVHVTGALILRLTGPGRGQEPQ